MGFYGYERFDSFQSLKRINIQSIYILKGAAMRKLILLLASVVLVAVCFAGCYGREEGTNVELAERFTCVMASGSYPNHEIWRDNKTGVLYWSMYMGNQRSMTILVDENGKPLLDKEACK